VDSGQFSSAILEYETILQRHPEDPDIQEALSQIEAKSGSFPVEVPPQPAQARIRTGQTEFLTKLQARDIDDGRRAMHRLLVEGKHVPAGDFDVCWPTADLDGPMPEVRDPFIQVLADKALFPIDRSLKLLSDKSRSAFLPLATYDIDVELARSFPAKTCRRWCILPFDRMSKSIFVATANPFNQQAARELIEGSESRLLWYLVPPMDLVKLVRKIYRA
jgi:hypothetical protein